MMEMVDYSKRGKVTPTRFSEGDCSLFIWHQDTNVWRFLIKQNGVTTTGPQCKTKDEAFSVLPSVAKQWGIAGYTDQILIDALIACEKVLRVKHANIGINSHEYEAWKLAKDAILVSTGKHAIEFK